MTKSSLCDECKMAEHFIKIGRKQGRLDGIEEYRREMHDMIVGNEEFIDWQKHEICECNELVAELLKEKE